MGRLRGFGKVRGKGGRRRGRGRGRKEKGRRREGGAGEGVWRQRWRKMIEV